MFENDLSLQKLLTRDRLRNIASSAAVYERGVDYAQKGYPEIIERDDNRIIADIEGGDLYRVTIEAVHDDLDVHCTCLAMRDYAGSCKHIIAVGLAALESKPDKQKTPSRKQQISDYLDTRSAEDLKNMILDIVAKEKPVRQFLLRQAALQQNSGNTDKLFKTIKSQITEATRIRGFIDYYEAAGWFEPVIELIRMIRSVVLPKDPLSALKLCEYIYERLETAIDNIDDSNGESGEALDLLAPIFLESCAAAKLEPDVLAEKIFSLKTENWLFDMGVYNAREALGEDGWPHYVRLVRQAYAALPAPDSKNRFGRSGPVTIYTPDNHNRYKIRSMMEDVLKQDGALDEKIDFFAQELDWPGQYIHIAKLCEEEGELDRAAQWLDKGLAAFKDIAAQDLPWERIALHLKCHEYQKAQERLWDVFTTRRDYMTWDEVRKYWLKIPEGARRSDLPALQKRALALLEKSLDDYRNRDTAIRIYLDMGKAQEAWKAFRKGSVQEELQTKIADALKTANPEKTLQIYTRLIEDKINQTDKKAYKVAVGYLEKIRSIMTETDFENRINDLRERFKRKRNLIKMLDRLAA